MPTSTKKITKNIYTPSPQAVKILEGLKLLPCGTYSVSDLQRLLTKTGHASWSTGWTTVHKCLRVASEWRWNGLKAPSMNKWIKDPPKPMPVPHDHTPKMECPEPIQKGQVSLALERIEVMLEVLCKNLGITIPTKG